MLAARSDRNFHVVYAGGPMNGIIEPGEDSMALCNGQDGSLLCMKIRWGTPWYNRDQIRPSIRLAEAERMHELAGIDPWDKPVYVLEETSDPDVYRYRFIGDYDPVRDAAPQSFADSLT